MSPQGAMGFRMEGIRGLPTGSANLATGKIPVKRGTARTYLNLSREELTPYNFLPWLDGLMCADAIRPKRLCRFRGS